MPDSTAEQRSAARQPIVRNGRIAFTNFRDVVDCSIRDISDRGAKVIAMNPSAVPDRFHLILVTDRMMREAKVAWREGREIGVEFEGASVDLARAYHPKLRQFLGP